MALKSGQCNVHDNSLLTLFVDGVNRTKNIVTGGGGAGEKSSKSSKNST